MNGIGKTDSSHAATESDGAAAKLPRCNTKVYAAYRMTSILDKHGVNKCLITRGKPDRSVSWKSISASRRPSTCTGAHATCSFSATWQRAYPNQTQASPFGPMLNGKTEVS